jgi:glucose-1-phosphate cytidylyltransferase
MKVVLFCGGFGMRLKEFSESVPKPLVPVGNRPIIWHLMKYYAHYGHKDFILALGWNANAFKQYFLNYDECVSNDFVLTGGGRNVNLLHSDIDDWKITFVDTGAASNIGQRLRAVRPYLDGEETFLANYSDGLCDLHLPDLIEFHREHNATASFLTVKPMESFHTIEADEDGVVHDICAVRDSSCWINAGFFVMQNEIFDDLHEGEELVIQPFRRLIERQQLRAYKHEGFFACMDTFKQKQQLDDMMAAGQTPWAVWQKPRNGARRANVPAAN